MTCTMHALILAHFNTGLSQVSILDRLLRKMSRRRKRTKHLLPPASHFPLHRPGIVRGPQVRLHHDLSVHLLIDLLPLILYHLLFTKEAQTTVKSRLCFQALLAMLTSTASNWQSRGCPRQRRFRHIRTIHLPRTIPPERLVCNYRRQAHLPNHSTMAITSLQRTTRRGFLDGGRSGFFPHPVYFCLRCFPPLLIGGTKAFGRRCWA